MQNRPILKQSLTLLFLLCCTIAAAEDSRQIEEWCRGQGGRYAVSLPDDAICACLTGEYALDIQPAHRWTDAIGRGLAAARQTGKKAGIALVLTLETDKRFVEDLKGVLAFFKLPIQVWEIRMDPATGEQAEWEKTFAEAQEKFDAEKYEKALKLLADLLKKDPQSIKGWLLMGQSYQNLKLPLDAVACYKKVIDIDPVHAKAHFNMGFSYDYAGWTNAAFEQYKILKPLHPDLAGELFRIIMAQ